MDNETYKEKLREIEDNANKQILGLYRDYALSNAKYEIGDTIRGSGCTLVVDKITVGKSFGDPTAIYHGFELKKDLTPRKDGNRAQIWGYTGVELIKKG